MKHFLSIIFNLITIILISSTSYSKDTTLLVKETYFNLDSNSTWYVNYSDLFEYDSKGRLITVYNERNDRKYLERRIVYEGNKKLEYSANDYLISETIFNDNGQEIKRYDYRYYPDDKQYIDSLITHEYNENGYLIKKESFAGYRRDTLELVERIEYSDFNEFGLPEFIKNYWSYHNSTGEIRYRISYNDKGHIVRIGSFGGNPEENHSNRYRYYDDNDNEIYRKWIFLVDGKRYLAVTELREYDNNSNLTLFIQNYHMENGTIEFKYQDVFEYDEQNKLIRQINFYESPTPIYYDTSKVEFFYEDVVLSVEDKEENADGVIINIDPNPSNETHTLSIEAGNQSILSIQLFDLNGNLINDISNEKIQTIDISKLSAGTYLYMVKTNKGIKSKKFIINR